MSATAVTLLRLPISRRLAMLALLTTFTIRNDDFREAIRYSIQGVALTPLFTAVSGLRFWSRNRMPWCAGH